MTVRCGRCIGCRLDRTRDWGVRIALEASMHSENSFLTLTYSDDKLPPDGGLCVRDLQLFMKRLRSSIEPKKVRYYACGEYGENTWRPHYHVVLFGHEFPDCKVLRKTARDHLIYESAELDRLWGNGFTSVGQVTRQSGAYVARYVLKKISGDMAADHYLRPHPVTGELFEVAPEFALMSSRPGIGGAWFDKYHMDCFPSDFLVMDGKKSPVPSYFLKRTDRLTDSVYYGTKIDGTEVSQKEVIQRDRRSHARTPQAQANSTPDRLAVREELTQLRVDRLKRDME